ncbi:MAG TPA: YsnF/AvaK domain-containing protein [Gemmatimonadales bacterium]|nr:YsnF/AvaK domain-containing protein [Gemmatimonadales bacterium]
MARGKKNDIQVDNESGTVVGLFQDQPSAEAAIQRLKTAGFTEQQIGVAVRDREQQDALTEGTGTQAAEDATKGAVGGGVVGGVIGLLAGVGALAIPGVGPIIAGGALASTLAGAGIGAAAGGLIGALVGMGVPEEDARHFEQGFKQGGILVTVQAGTRAELAREALSEVGADLGPTRRDYSRPATAGSAVGAVGTEGSERLELREEQLDVDTHQRQAGEVRVRKEVHTEQRNIEVPVTREEVVIERHAVSGREAADQTLDDNEEVRIPLMEEEVDVQKRAVVREEISVGKRPVEETRTVSDTVRREEARIESEGDVGIRPYGGTDRRRGRQPSYKGPERRVALQR